jgi:two-component system OmpR family response regulator
MKNAIVTASDGRNNSRILVVDDDESVTSLVSMGLRSKGCVVRTENEPYAAFEAAKAFNPDLILLDVVMPRLDGGDLAQRLRSHPETAGIPVIFLTGMIRRDEVLEAGGVIAGDEFIAKPANIEEIAARILRQLKQ